MKALRQLVFPLAAVAAAFAVGAIVIALVGDDPIATYQLLIGSALSWPDGIGYTLFYATPLIFTGLAVAVAYRCGLLNIGAEGQLYAAAFATAWVGITCAGLSPWLLVPLAGAAAIFTGAAWGALPGVLKARFGAHEVITTILLNFVAVAVASYLTQYHAKQEGDAILETAPIGEHARIARLGRLLPGFPERIPLNAAFLLALAACVLVYLFLWRTRWGYEIRATGLSPAAAAYGGIATGRQIVVAMALSGGLAGMVGINEVLGYRYRYYDGFSTGYGFFAIAVALLARSNPWAMLPSAFLFGALTSGSRFMQFQTQVSSDVISVVEATVIMFVAAPVLFQWIFRLRRAPAPPVKIASEEGAV